MIIQAAVFSIQWTELHNPASEFYPSETHRLLLTLSLHLVASTSPHASMRANALSALGDIGIWTPFLHSALPVIKRIYPTNYPDDQQLTLNILQSLFSLVYNERLDSATFIQLSTSLQSVMHLDGSMAATRLPELERRILAGFKQMPLSKYDSEWTSARKGSVLDNSIDTTQPQDKQSLQLGVSSTALLSPNMNTTIGSPNSFTSSTTLPSPLSSMNSVELASPRSNALVIPSPFDVPYRQFVTDFCSTLASHSPFSFLRTLKPLFAISVELSEKLVMPLLLDCLWSDAPANITTLSVFFETIFKQTAEPDSPDGSEDGMMVDDTPTHIPRIEASIFRFLLSVLEQIRQHDTIQLRTILNRDSSPFDQNMNHTTLFGKCLVQYRQASHPPLDEEYPSSLFSLLHIDLIEAAQVAVRVEMHDFALLLVEMWCGQVVEEYHEAKVKSAQAILQAIFKLNSKSTQRSSTQLKAQSARLSEQLAQVTGNLFIDPTTELWRLLRRRPLF
ncbi:hypothetical protein BLNAU_8045 [Blattamonas nauphoetae]|uniref:Uncharacterized protein n=1 Tax=Blattamonas nauphoetae TaxID=2049346 RepID=A0ABQ9XZS3_9EUKA|nr:hypothetical protein BLNAU_8045 [Blattamonas nauphoetae]